MHNYSTVMVLYNLGESPVKIVLRRKLCIWWLHTRVTPCVLGAVSTFCVYTWHSASDQWNSKYLPRPKLMRGGERRLGGKAADWPGHPRPMCQDPLLTVYITEHVILVHRWHSIIRGQLNSENLIRDKSLIYWAENIQSPVPRSLAKSFTQIKSSRWINKQLIIWMLK